jgi:hypothetical protein
MSMVFVPEEEPMPIVPVWGMGAGRSFDQSSRDDEDCLCCSCCGDSGSMEGWETQWKIGSIATFDFMEAQTQSRQLIRLKGECAAIQQQIRVATAPGESQVAAQRVGSPVRWCAWSTESLGRVLAAQGSLDFPRPLQTPTSHAL